MNSQVTTIFFITDIQTSDADDATWSLGGSPEEYRRYSTSVTRTQEFVADANLASPDLVIHAGDLVDGNATADQVRTLGQAIITELGNLNDPFLAVAGNHERTSYNGSGDRPSVSDYYTDLDTIHVTRSNTYEDANGFISFTYDVNELRIIALDSRGSAIESGLLSWFETQLAASPYPVVVLSHFPAWELSYAWAYYTDYADVQTKINAAGNVQAYLCGHYHPNNIDTVINNVSYKNFWGSVNAPDVGDNAYFKIEILPECVYTSNGMKPNIKITGYGTKGTSKTIDYTQYAAI